MRVAVTGTCEPIHDGHRRLFERGLEFGTHGVVVPLTSEATGPVAKITESFARNPTGSLCLHG